MKHFTDRPFSEFVDGARSVLDKWKKIASGNRKILAVFLTVITDAPDDPDPDTFGRARLIEGENGKQLARAARTMCDAMWKVSPALCGIFVLRINELMEESLGGLFEQWAKKKGLVPGGKLNEEEDPELDLDEEVAYSLYFSSRKKGTSHETLVQIDEENERFRERYEREQGAE